MKRYSIMVMEEGSKHEKELCQCESNPEAVAAAARQKKRQMNDGNKKWMEPRYTLIRIQDNQAK